MRLITASHITDWANRDKRDCQAMLPVLIRRLVRATASRVERIDFPGGDAVSDEGWDGRLVCAADNPFVPDGASGWEIGSDKSAAAKSDRDYEKRVEDPLDLDPAATAFVFVTPRAWPKRHIWEKRKRAEGRWSDVRVAAAGELEQWLEDAPAVAMWLAKHLRVAPPAGLAGLEAWWGEWAAATRPVMTPAMLVGGREAQVEQAKLWSKGAADRLEIQADSPDEAIAFLRAAAAQWSDAEQETLLSRCVVASTEEAFRAAAAWTTPLVIAAPAEAAQPAAGAALRQDHRLFLAVSRTLTSKGRSSVRLPPVDRLDLEQALVDADLPREEAVGVVAGCGRSVAVLHRQRSAIDAVRRPAWATPGNGELLVPALLAGAWSEEVRPTRDGLFGRATQPLLDLDILRRLSAANGHEAAVAPVRRLSAGDDPPFRRASSVWRLTAALDAWYRLGDFVQSRDLEGLRDAAADVFGVLDPRYELPDEQQWAAGLYGKERPHSGWLREGLAISLAIVAQHGEQLRLPVPYGTTSGFVDRAVERVLSGARGWQAWASLGDVLPILAEAAPEAVLSAVEALIAVAPAEARSLLTDGGGPDNPMGECRHAGLLWALERLAWHPEHLARCCLILARLDGLDPHGRWGNRPAGSLFDILFGPGDPYTFADAQRCLEAVDAVTAEAPATAWRLLLQATERLSMRMLRDPPAYLQAKPDGWRPWSAEESRTFWTGMSDRLQRPIEAGDRDHIVGALGRLALLPDAAQAAVAAWLDRAALSPVGDGGDLLWTAVRGALHRLRTYGGDRRLAPGMEEALDRADARLAPTDPMAMASWLFAREMPQLAEGEPEDWSAHQRLVEERRVAVIRELLDAMGAEALLRWSVGLPDQHSLGLALQTAADEDADRELSGPMLSLARPELPGPPSVLLAYAVRRFNSQGQDWLERWLAAAGGSAEPAAAAAALCCALPFRADAWRRAEAFGPEVERLYWRWATAFLDDAAPAADHEHVAERLVAAGRSEAALHFVLRGGAPNLPGSLLLRLGRAVVQQLLTAPIATADPNIAWKLDRLFVRLDEAEGLAAGDVAALEWPLLSVLVHTERKPKALHALLASDPVTFAQLVCWAWRRDDEASGADGDEEHATPEGKTNRAEAALKLLQSWKGRLPGQSADDLDAAALQSWVAEARRLCREAGRSRIGDLKIGEMLANAPVDPSDGAWPHRAVRQVLGALRSEEADRGFQVGAFNSRGATTRRSRDGGAQERALAARYDGWASAMRGSAPHAARLLGRIAESYRADAKREDAQAELYDLR